MTGAPQHFDHDAFMERRDRVIAIVGDVEPLLRAGRTVTDVRAALLACGHRSDEIDEAIEAVTDPDTGSVPRPKTKVPIMRHVVPTSGNVAKPSTNTRSCPADVPDIILPAGSASISECARDVFSRFAGTKNVFSRGGMVCRVVTDAQGIRVEVVTEQQFRSDIEKLGSVKIWRYRDDRYVLSRAICSADAARALLSSNEARECLPKLRGIANAPVLCQGLNGPQLLGRGLHEENGLLVTGGNAVADIPLAEALNLLSDMLDGFSFLTAADKARALAMCITPALRMGGWLLREVVAFVIEADQSQSGKGYLLKLLFALYNETPYLIARREGGVGSVDESFQAGLLAGRPFLQIDNLRNLLDSQFIEAVLTAGAPVMCRVPHRGEIAVDPHHFVLFLTSNGVATTRDFVNRSCVIRIRKTAGPFKQYPEGDILDHVEANQGRFLGAVHSIIREWCARGCPVATAAPHDFRHWANMLTEIVGSVMGAGVLLDGHAAAKERCANPTLNWLRDVALAIVTEGKLDEPLFASQVAEICNEHDIDLPGIDRGATESDRNRRTGHLLKKSLGESEAVAVDDFSMTRGEKEHFYPAEQQYKTLKTYTFHRNSRN